MKPFLDRLRLKEEKKSAWIQNERYR